MKATRKKQAHNVHETNARAVLSVTILLLAFAIMELFYKYKDSIIANGMLMTFLILIFIGMGLFICLLFLVNPSHKK